MLRNDKEQRHAFPRRICSTAFDFDATMLRIGAMNMTLHGDRKSGCFLPRQSRRRTRPATPEAYSLILANPPFAGSLDYDSTAKDLQKIVKTKKTELLFAALFLRLLRTGGRAAVVVPDGVLFRLLQGPQGHPPDAGRRSQARCHHQTALRRLSPLCWGLDCAIIVIFTKTRCRRHGKCLVLRHDGGWLQLG